VLANDVDLDLPGDSLTAVLVQDVSNGILTLGANGSVSYTPETNFKDLDSFKYQVSDGTTLSNIATVTIQVGSTNNAPEAVDDTYGVDEGGTLNVAASGVLGNDTDPGDTLTAVLVRDVSNGTLTLDGDGSFSYIHDGSETVSDGFTYQANDGTARSNVAVVTIAISAVNDPPAAADDSAGTAEETAVVIAVLANDRDAEDDVLGVTALGQAANGTVVLNADKTVTYTPNADFTGAGHRDDHRKQRQ
jgi:VCBS repeat-containing protein